MTCVLCGGDTDSNVRHDCPRIDEIVKGPRSPFPPAVYPDYLVPKE